MTLKTTLICLAVVFSLLSHSATAEMIQLEPQGGVYVVPVRVNGTLILPFIIDSGAADVAIPGDVFLTLSRTGTVKPGDFVGRQTYVLADGSELPSDRFILRELRVGDHVVRNVIAHVANVKGDPLLGQSFLSKLPAWSIDNQRHALVLHDGAGQPGGQQQAAVRVPTTLAPPPQAVPAPITPTPPAVPGPAVAGYGAVAFDEKTAKYGFGWNEDTQKRADEAALQACNAEGCKIAFRVLPRQCGALATGEKGTAWGGHVGGTRDAAELRAIEDCQKHTSGKCVVRGSDCNGVQQAAVSVPTPPQPQPTGPAPAPPIAPTAPEAGLSIGGLEQRGRQAAVANNYADAMKWCRLAATKGSAFCEDGIGDMYRGV